MEYGILIVVSFLWGWCIRSAWDKGKRAIDNPHRYSHTD